MSTLFAGATRGRVVGRVRPVEELAWKVRGFAVQWAAVMAIRGQGLFSDKQRTKRLAMLLVCAGAIVSSFQIYWHTFLDESENLYFGYLMSRGEILYSDLFSHHFPFPYWWIAVVTYVFGKSIAAVRLSLVFFQAVAFFAAVSLTAAPIAVALSAFVWSLVAYLYFGNLLIAYTFKALAVMVLVAGGLLGAPNERPAVGSLLYLGTFGAIAVLTDPTAVYIVLVIVGVSWFRFGWRAALWLSVPGVMSALGTVMWMHLVGNFDQFWQFAVEYNRNVYGVLGRRHATAVNVIFPYDGLIAQGSTGLRILDPRWWDVLPGSDLSIPGALHDRWVVTGLAFRLYFILATVMFLRAGDWWRAAGIYGIAALALALRGEEGFHSSTFALGAILSGCSVLTGEVAPHVRRVGSQIVAALGLSLLAGAAGNALWMERATLSYTQSFGYYEDIGRKLQHWTCGDGSVRVSFWPSDLLVNWFGDRRPVSRHTYALPWTLGIGEKEILEGLRSGPSVIMVNLDGTVGPFKNADYLESLLRVVRMDSVEVERGVFVSKSLVGCQH